MAWAPRPGSSAGWKTTRTVPSNPPRLGQGRSGAQEHRHVPVVPAGVHRARVGGVGPGRSLAERQRVHVGTQSHYLGATARDSEPTSPVPPIPLLTSSPRPVAGPARVVARPVLAERRLRVLVQVVPPAASPGDQGVGNAHGWLASRSIRFLGHRWFPSVLSRTTDRVAGQVEGGPDGPGLRARRVRRPGWPRR